MASRTRETPSGTERLQLRFPAAERRCSVVVGSGARLELTALWRQRWRQSALIGDATVLALHGEEVARALRGCCERVTVLDFPPGESHKNRATKGDLEDRLLAAGFDRHGCVVALGGGISLDLAGFVAATFMRGVDHINLPTSLLAQVDACIGGKTGVNTGRGKNLVGAIHQPAAVLVDPHYLGTLPAAQWPCGLAELVKHAVIADAELFDWIENHVDDLLGPPWRGGGLPLRRCVEIKGHIVQRDERERGLRGVLNYGHTAGHALEKAARHRLDHGRAVAIGMVLEGRVAREICGFTDDELRRLTKLLGRLGLPTAPPEELAFDSLLPFLAVDKKRRQGELRLALPRAIGSMSGGEPTMPVPVTALRRAWDDERGS